MDKSTKKQTSVDNYDDHQLSYFTQPKVETKRFKAALASSIWLSLFLIWLPGFGFTAHTIDIPKPKPKEEPIHVVLKQKPHTVLPEAERQAPKKPRIPLPDFLVETPPIEFPDEELPHPPLVESTNSWAEPDLPESIPELVDPVFTTATAGIEAPTVTHRQKPKYPKRALNVGIQGYVILEAVLGKDGTVRDIRVLRGLGKGRFGFEEAAIEALKQWDFLPGKLNGRNVDIRMSLKITFAIQR